MCLLKPPCFRDRALTSVIDGGVRGAEDQGDGCTHVQLRQRQLVHEIWELMERNHMGMVTSAWHLPWIHGDGAPLGAVMLLRLTLILLNFFWILLDTCSAQYCSRRKSQKMRPTSAFIQAMHVSPRLAVSSPSCGGTEATSPWSEVAPGAVG